MRKLLALTFAFSCVASAPAAMAAASLQVSPVRLDLPAGASTPKLTLSNDGSEAVSAQVRLFKWVQEGGADKLVETRDVVASPPVLVLEPGKTNVVRIVRTSKVALAHEEAYRVLVDQIPEKGSATATAVSFQLRYSIPVFFSPKGEQSGDLAWSIKSGKGKTILEVSNPGNSHVRLSRIKIGAEGRNALYEANGLIGYVLAGSTVRIELKTRIKGLKPGQQVSIEAEANATPIQAMAEYR